MNWWPTCTDVSRELSASRDAGGALPWPVRLHLAICDVCRRVRAQFDVLGNAVGKAGGFGPLLSPEAKDRLRRALSKNE